ncbi:MAG: hypothetical protein HY308_06545 [Gammaproteobacteria bacterium]|nr:hypothetical protein [Gammaproteobacteria bacterium]
MIRFLAIILALATFSMGCASMAATSGRVVIQDSNASVDIGINAHDRAVIEDYYQPKKKKNKGIPPGHAKRGGGLPPGLAKRGKVPPGFQGEPLPVELERQLTPLPAGYVRVHVDHDIVLFNRNTRVVFDILHDLPL